MKIICQCVSKDTGVKVKTGFSLVLVHGPCLRNKELWALCRSFKLMTDSQIFICKALQIKNPPRKSNFENRDHADLGK